MNRTTDAAPRAREVLAAVAFLSDLPVATLERIAPRVVERAVPKGGTICREGDPCAGFWIVATGSANILKIGPDGRIQILETVPAGGLFALVSAVDGGDYPATVEAREMSRLVLVPSPLLCDIILEYPEVGLGIARHFALRLRRATCRSASVCLRSVRSRLAAHLLEAVAASRREGPPESILLSLGASQEELAHRLGTVREVLARTLRSFRDENLIAQRGDSVTILDVPALERVAES